MKFKIWWFYAKVELKEFALSISSLVLMAVIPMIIAIICFYIKPTIMIVPLLCLAGIIYVVIRLMVDDYKDRKKGVDVLNYWPNFALRTAFLSVFVFLFIKLITI